MKQFPIWVGIISLFLLLKPSKSNDDELVRNTLLQFISKLSNTTSIPDPSSGWNSSSYPCKDKWKGINCDNASFRVKEITLGGHNFSGFFDPKVLCSLQSLSESLLVLNITSNKIQGENLENIGNCSQLTELVLASNQFSGTLPKSISQLTNLKILDLSGNKISGSLPDLSQIQGLEIFQAQENQFSGSLPNIDFSNFSSFNVSYNNLTGPIPRGLDRFNVSSFIHNPELCGPPLPDNCTKVVLTSSNSTQVPPVSPPAQKRNDPAFIYAGYGLIALAVFVVVLLFLYKKLKTRTCRNLNSNNKVSAVHYSTTTTMPSFSTVELKSSKNEHSTDQSGLVSSSLVVVTSPDQVNGLRFEDLLKAPAELLGRGNHGSVYKVVCEGTSFVVKRIKDWMISSSEFRQRMRRLNEVKHDNVLNSVAYYSSREEKLLVYEYQENGSLFKLIHANGDKSSQTLDWTSRLSIAATISNALAFMHEQLHYDKIPHGNLKSSNILLNKKMQPCISEYGLMLVENNHEHHSNILTNTVLEAAQESYKSLFKEDTYAFGVILLELLTGRMVLTDGFDLASWVLAVVREEWTVEVFDRNLVREGASEERMVNLLQIAIKCVDKSPEARSSMKEVALMVSAIRDDDERSIDVSELSLTRSFIDL